MNIKRPINAVIQHDPSPEYACKLLTELRRQGYVMHEIAALIGVSANFISRSSEAGFVKFQTQYIVEALAGER